MRKSGLESSVGFEGSNGTLTSLGGNFIHTYVEAQNLNDFTLKVTTPIDQEVDPAFSDDTPGSPFPGVDLRPDGSAGSPDLWQADGGILGQGDGVWHSGALEPFNLSTLATVAGAGTTSLYGERKQKIYENSFGKEPTRGRGIRMRLRSTDIRSKKLYAGLWVRHAGEEPK